MKETLLTVLENTRLAEGIYRLRLTGDTSAITAPGQFVNLKLSGFYLRRPISVCDWTEGELTLIYKVLGHGTEAMTRMAPGTELLNVLTGLGNGYDVSRSGEHPLLVGGGVGIPPLYGLAKRLTAQDKRTVTAVLGFNRESEVFLAEGVPGAGGGGHCRHRRWQRRYKGPCNGRYGRRFRLYLSLHLRPGADAESGIRCVQDLRPVQL